MPSWLAGLDGATVVMEMGFGFAPSVAIGATTFSAITGDVRDCTITYGRLNERDDYQAGTMQLVVGNLDRDYDPLYLAGPHVGQLLPGCRIRAKVTVAGVTVALFTGYVTQLPQMYDIGGDAVVVIQAVDGFSVLQRAVLPSLYAYEVSVSGPILQWRFGEQLGTTAVSSAAYLNTDGTYEGGATFNSRAGLIVDNDTAIAFTAPQTATKVGYPFPPGQITVEVWFATTLAAPSFYYPVRIVGGSSVVISVQSGQITAGWSDTAGKQSNRVSTLSTYNDGLTHHVVANWPDGATLPTLYIDGVADTTGATGLTATVAALGTVVINVPSPFTPFWVGTIDEFALYGGLDATRVAKHYAAGSAPFAGLDTGAVINKILDMAGWPTADRTIETGKSTVTSINTAGRSALDVIKDVEKTEQGRFFIAPDGKATFYNRHHTLVTTASLTVQTTFGDAAGERPYVGIETDYGNTYIRNKVSAQRAGGSPFVVSDGTSIAAYGEYNDSVTGLLNSSDGEIRDLAQWRLGHYKDPATRITSLTVNPRIDPTNTFPVVRDRKLLDRVTVKRRPGPIGAPVGPAISIDVLIEGVQHRISADQTWATTYSLSPAEVQSYLVLDNATLGRLDLNKLAF